MTDTQGDLSSDSSITQQQQIPNSSADTNSSNTTNSSKSEMSNITSIVTQSSDESTLIDTSGEARNPQGNPMLICFQSPYSMPIEIKFIR